MASLAGLTGKDWEIGFQARAPVPNEKEEL